METIAVLMPVKDGASVISRALDSIANQTAFRNGSYDYRVIVVNDKKSTDNLKEIVKNYPKVDYLEAQFPGLVPARNTSVFHALSHPEYTYLAVLDSDDAWLPEKIEKQMPFLTSGICDVCGTGLRFLMTNGTNDVIYPESHERIMESYLNGHNPLGHSSLVFHKKIFFQCGGYDDNCVGEDYDLFSRAARFFRFYNIPEVLVEYNYDYDKRPREFCNSVESGGKKVYLKFLVNHDKVTIGIAK